mmetsp:Transcript_17630/g.30237  ORF Transcript_17630/g.30237 Transcript_17630/m.30237 type:complete len:110 (+) Transcript_17630:142-471(+)
MPGGCGAPGALIPAPHVPAGEAKALPTVSGVPLSVLREVLIAQCTPLRKLRVLLRLLDCGLKEVVASWETRQLQACGLDADDAVHLLCALFEASEHRKTAISRIRASSW